MFKKLNWWVFIFLINSMSSKVVCFGEVLWDVFPDDRKIGGAPLNVALRLASYGNAVAIISKVGDDSDGEQIINYLSNRKVDTGPILKDPSHDTGKVMVNLNHKGSATYEIVFPCAWDYLELNEYSIKLLENSDAFVFGSLASRNDVSRRSLYKAMEIAKYKVFDVNLRPPHFDQKLLVDLMNRANLIKLNDDELFEICKFLGSKYNSIEQNIEYIAKHTASQHVCVTKGRHGAVLLYDGTFYYNSGYLITVTDTVGAGDSFLASLLDKLLNGSNPQEAIDFACAVGALVATNKGANPDIKLDDIKQFINPYSQ